MDRILVTGGAGFVGSNLAISFKRDFPGVEVVTLDNLRRRGSELNIPRLRSAGVEFLHGDIRNRSDLREAGGFDLLVECSAEPSVTAGYGSSPEYVVDTNLSGTLNCLEAARQHNACVIFLSTSRVYPIGRLASIALDEGETRFVISEGQALPGISPAGVSELFPMDGPRSLYGATKFASEIMMQEYLDMYGLHGIINRCGVLTGPWQMGKVDQGVVVLWLARHHFRGSLSYLGYGGRGKQIRDLLHVEDLYTLLRLQLDLLPRFSGEVYNVGGGTELSVSLRELTALAAEATGNGITITEVPETRVADIPCYVSDCRKVMRDTGWAPQRSLGDIVREIADWLRNNEDLLRPLLG